MRYYSGIRKQDQKQQVVFNESIRMNSKSCSQFLSEKTKKKIWFVLASSPTAKEKKTKRAAFLMVMG